MLELALPDEAATVALGARLAPLVASRAGGVLYLRGELGAGKTTLARALLHALGVQGRVKSPTYTLVEYYPLAHTRVLHLDLYRLTDPEELWNLGVFDDPPSSAWWLVEWPEKGGALLPKPDIELQLGHRGSSREARISLSTASGFTLGMLL